MQTAGPFRVYRKHAVRNVELVATTGIVNGIPEPIPWILSMTARTAAATSAILPTAWIVKADETRALAGDTLDMYIHA
jgi:hypothetical protein